MKVTLLASGTRGDVQPHVALALGLQRAGHTVRLGTHDAFERFVTQYGLEYFHLTGSPYDRAQTEEGRSIFAAGNDRVRFMNVLLRIHRSHREAFEADVAAACEGADAVIYSTLAVAGRFVAQQRGVPSVLSALQPLAPLYFWGPYRQLERERSAILYGFSSLVMPRRPEWGDWIDVTGFWYLDRPEDWQPPPGLEAFIADGPAPVSIGFGSMTDLASEELTAISLRALEAAGQRAVLLTGWGGLKNEGLPEWVFPVQAVPYDWLFPRVAAAVHQGGAGTTAEALRAGIPSVIVPFFADQFVWGERIAALGIGPDAIPRERLDAEQLAAAIRTAVTDEAMRRAAREMGAGIRAERGVERAVEAFARHVRV